MNTFSKGVWSGIFATSAMTLFFLESFKALPARQQHPLPPGTITDDTLEFTGTKKLTNSEDRQNLSLLNHYGYGVTLSLLYSLISKRFRGSPVAYGGAFGIGVWLFSYLGWLPAMNYRASAFKMSKQRNLLMIGAHLIWGVTLGYSESRLRHDGKHIFDGGSRGRNTATE